MLAVVVVMLGYIVPQLGSIHQSYAKTCDGAHFIGKQFSRMLMMPDKYFMRSFFFQAYCLD